MIAPGHRGRCGDWPMPGVLQAAPPARASCRWLPALAVGLNLVLGACSGTGETFSNFSNSLQPAPPPQNPTAIGTGKTRVGLILPFSATGNAGVAAHSMKN